jgi:RND family efflux transporter MFP subunit
VEVVEVKYGSFPLEERLSGTVRARNQTEVYSEVAGTIASVFVEDGARVNAGDPLVRLRARDSEERVRQAESGLEVAQARVRRAEASLFEAKTNLERVEAIVKNGLGPKAQLDTARAAAISAEADLDLMKAQLEQASSVLGERRAELADSIVSAPIDGIVGRRNAEVGQQASTSSPLFTIGDVDDMRVELILTQQMLGYIDVGTSVEIYSDTAPDRKIQSEITRISPFLHSVTHTTRAEIDVNSYDGLLRPGMFVTVDVLYGESEEASLLPNSAVYRHPQKGGEGVFIAYLEEALSNPEHAIDSPLGSPPFKALPVPVTARFMPIEVVARGRDSSAVRGVQPGEWVVTLGHHLLASSDEQPVMVHPTPWAHILDLQALDNRDLLDIIREKQQQSVSIASAQD